MASPAQSVGFFKRFGEVISKYIERQRATKAMLEAGETTV